MLDGVSVLNIGHGLCYLRVCDSDGLAFHCSIGLGLGWCGPELNRLTGRSLCHLETIATETLCQIPTSRGKSFKTNEIKL